ncbi:MAG: T9SS type A sorting domain-containing protein [Bacteroidota bacterium]
MQTRYLLTEGGATAITVSNQLGQPLYHQRLDGGREGQLQISTADWARGMYFIQLHTDRGSTSERVLLR